MQGRVGSICYRHQVVGAKCLAAPVAVKLIATGAEHLAASRAGVLFEEYVPAILVVFGW
jgi:hypothetical protein